MSDRVGIFLALVAFVIISIVVVKNYNFAADDVQFTEGGFYVAGTQADRQMSEKQLLAQMNGVRNVHCPQTAISQTEHGMCRIAVYNNGTLWRNECFFIPNEYLNEKYKLHNPITPYWDETGKDTRCAVDLMHLDSSIAKTLNPKMSSLISDGTGSGSNYKFPSGEQYAELISPFQFVFENLNTSSKHTDEAGNDVEKIVIVSKDGKCRITFDNVANWFCAGDVGEKGEAVSSVWNEAEERYDPVYKTWEEHATGENVHYSIIGNSGNAIVSGGGAGTVIGYAKGDTTVKVEYLAGSTWTELSVYQWIMGVTQ